jgi:hypothetical protein
LTSYPLANAISHKRLINTIEKPSVNASPFLIILIIVTLEIFGKDGGDHHVDDQHDCHYQIVCYIELVGLDKG